MARGRRRALRAVNLDRLKLGATNSELIAPTSRANPMRPLDTSSHAEKIQLEIFRRMGPERRLQAAIDLAQTSRELLK